MKEKLKKFALDLVADAQAVALESMPEITKGDFDPDVVVERTKRVLRENGKGAIVDFFGMFADYGEEEPEKPTVVQEDAPKLSVAKDPG